jgi:hypothetical protein
MRPRGRGSLSSPNVRYFRRHSDESRGDNRNDWGGATYYFEVGDDLFTVRQIEVYDSGAILRYGPGHPENADGSLNTEQFDLLDFASFEIAAASFEDAWSAD